MNIDIRLRNAVSDAIRNSGKDRLQICFEMTKLTGVEISKHSLDAWSAESRAKSGDALDLNCNKRWGIPAELVPAFCEVTGDWTPLQLLVEVADFILIKGPRIIQAEIDRLAEQIEKAKMKKTNLEKSLAEMGE